MNPFICHDETNLYMLTSKVEQVYNLNLFDILKNII